MNTDLTIVGGRQHGKTEAALRLALDAAAGGVSVHYWAHGGHMARDAFCRAEQMTRRPERWPLVECVHRASGDERITFISGGVIRFLSSTQRCGVAGADVEILDDVDIDADPATPRVIWTALS